jgi:hypothetical protein
MNTINIPELKTFEQAVAAHEAISTQLEQASDPAKKKTLLKRITEIEKYISKTFKTRAAHSFLWEMGRGAETFFVLE